LSASLGQQLDHVTVESRQILAAGQGHVDPFDQAAPPFEVIRGFERRPRLAP
jgi:hypothetical protein